MTAATPLTVGMVLFDGLTQLDLTGPYELLARMPDTRVHLVAASLAPVRSEWGLVIVPDTTFDDAPPIDVLCVPGGWSVNANLSMPILIFQGRRDTAVNPKMVEAWAQARQNVELHMLDDDHQLGASLDYIWQRLALTLKL